MQNTQYNKRFRLLAVGLLSLAAQLVIGMGSTASAAIDPPAYDVHFIGGTPKAVNNLGQTAGWSTIVGVQRAWVFTGGAGLELLPVPAGWQSQANDINDNGVVVGNVGSVGSGGGAVQWRPTVNGYEMVEINTPVSDIGSTAVAINNGGDIVGTRTFMFEITPGRFTNATRGFLLESDGTLTENLSDLGFTTLPTDINDAGQIVGGSLRMTAGIVEDLGVPAVPEGETRYALTYINAINTVGQVGASTVLATSLGADRTAARFTDGIGWQILSFIGSQDAAYGINDAGDVTFSASFLCSGVAAPVVFLEGVGTFCIEDLLTDTNWLLIAPLHDSDINNIGQIVVSGENQVTGEIGALLLTPAGFLPSPTAPENLTAAAHAATGQQPWNSIELGWTDTSHNEKGFRIERRVQGGVAWSETDTVNTNTQSFRDLSVDTGVTYEYRVVAFSLSGDSLPSNTATATAPGTVIDTEAPVISFVSPADGEQVSGNVQITLNVTDNVAVTSVRIETLVNSSRVVICDVFNPSTDTVTCSWNAKKLSAGGYPLNATVSDALGNFSHASISIELVASTKGGGKGGDGGGKGGGKGKK